MHSCVGSTTCLMGGLLVGYTHFVVNYQWGIRPDISLCREKLFLLLILTVALLFINRIVQLRIRSWGLFGVLGWVGLLSFNAFLIDGCFQAYYGVDNTYSLIKVVSCV